MVEEMEAEPQEAIEGTHGKHDEFVAIYFNCVFLAFNRARGHSMEKYTEDLLQRRKPP